MLQTEQRESRRPKIEVARSIDALISARSQQIALGNRRMTFAYVIDKDFRRRIVPLTPIYELLLGCVVGGITVKEVQAKMASLYPELPTAEIARSVLFGLHYLQKNQILQLSERITKVDGEVEPPEERFYDKNNFGSSLHSPGSRLEGIL
jgi:hypothetical protein